MARNAVAMSPAATLDTAITVNASLVLHYSRRTAQFRRIIMTFFYRLYCGECILSLCFAKGERRLVSRRKSMGASARVFVRMTNSLLTPSPWTSPASCLLVQPAARYTILIILIAAALPLRRFSSTSFVPFLVTLSVCEIQSTST